ncbi:MAG: metallophosphoesterase, partial [Akkermansia sp.]|nr:metallophosphoesterase [Akkermansia sp.]
MAIQLLIFSDIHLDERNQNIVLEKIEALANIVATQDITVEKLIVIVAGDFTYSAQREQFDNIRAAFALFDELVRKKSKKIEIEYAFVPGNHDVNMLKNRDADEIIIDNISNKRNIEQREYKVLSERLECYNEFLKSLGIYNETDNYIYEDKLIRCENNFYIKLDLYNSSFLAKFNQEKGKLFIPLNAVRKNEKLDDYLTIAIIHHPLSWFEEKCRQELQNYIEESSNIFISGHEHAVDLYNKKKITSSVFHVEAPAFHENE